MVRIRYLGYFSQITGKREERLSVEDGITAGELMKTLEARYGREMREAFQRAYRGVVLIVNGKEVDRDHKLSHGDEIAISFPAGGGSGLESFFNPSSIAVFGATSSEKKLGFTLFKNIADNFEGELYPINPKEKEILGWRAYSSILEVEADVELAVLSIPGKYVLSAVEDCASKGVRACLILSAGFGETGEEGRAIQDKLAEIAGKSGMRIVGPNCMGILDTHTGLNASYFWDVPMEKGNVAFISQSGAFGGVALHYARTNGLKFSKFVSIGNMADVSYIELMEYLREDETTDVIMLLLEGVKQGKRFMETLKSVTPEKPVLIYKIGRTSAGTRAAMSHTGSMAGEYRVFESACRQGGGMIFREFEKMLDSAYVLSNQPLPESDGIAIVTISGGPGVAVSDLCEELGVSVPEFDEELKARLKNAVSPIAAISNPLDMTPATPFDAYYDCFDAVLSAPYVGGVIAINVGLDSREFGDSAVRASRKHKKPVIAYVIDDPEIERIFKNAGIPILPSPERCAFAFHSLIKYAKLRGVLDERLHVQ